MKGMEPLSKYDLYRIRMLLFLEVNPQSNKYRQVLITPEEFKTISLSLGQITSKNGDDEHVSMDVSEEIYDLPDLIEHK